MRKLSGYGPSLIVLGTAIVVLLAGPSAVWHLTYAQTKARIIQASEGLETNPILQQLNQAYRDIASLVEPSVVHISTERTVRNRFGEERVVGSSGSGWIYDDDGHIVTNYHVIQDAERIEVQLNTGEMRQGEMVGYDQFTDIAVVKIPSNRLFPAVRSRPDEMDGPLVSQGDLVFAFGSPFDFRFSMSSGVVSGIGRSVGVIRDDRGRWMGYENFIQVDAAINPGNSGGPLTDTRGHVIGMNTAIATGRSNGLDEGQFAGIGLAIPIDMIEPVVTQIIKTGSVQKGFLGVSVLDRHRTVAEELSIQEIRGYGLTVGRIEPGNPALEAGLRVGDVITQVGLEPVATLAQLDTVTSAIDPDDEVQLTIWRYDQDLDRSGQQRITLSGVVANGFRGVWLLQLDEQLSDWLSVLGFAGRGVRISRLEMDMPARRAGLEARDVVTEVNGDPVASVAQLRSRISSMMPGDVAVLRVWRYDPQSGRGRHMDIEVRLDRLDPLRVTGTIPQDQEHDSLDRLGIARMSTATPALADEYGVRFRTGVLVQQLVRGSELDGTMEPGSIIVAVMDRAVRDVDEFFELLENFDLRDTRGVRISFIRPDGTREDTVLRLR